MTMKKILILFISLLSGTVLFAQQESAKVTFKLITPEPERTAVFITGNDVQLGEWDPGKIVLSPDGEKSYSITLSFSPGTELEYKFTKGSWEKEALYQKGVLPGNFRLKVTKDTTVTATVAEWSNQKKVTGQITGTVEYIRNTTGEGLLPRDIIIRLPEGYNTSTDRYPVLYMHDGQNIFDPKTCGFGVDWQLDEWADSLNRTGAMRKTIIVGLYNTSHRRAEYGLTDTGAAYMKYLVTKIKPMIDSAYRTLPDKNNTFVGGSSMGGLISFRIIWTYPDVFAGALCFSPAFKFMWIDAVTEVEQYSGPKKNIKFYFDNGGVGLDANLQPGLDAMLSALNKQGYKEGKDYMLVIDKDADHNETAWAKRAGNALLYILGTR